MATPARALRLVVPTRPIPTKGSLLAAAAYRCRLLSATPEAGGAGDPAVHSGDAPSDDYTERPPRFSGAEEAVTTTEASRGSNKNHAPAPKEKERAPPFAASGKLGSQELADAAGGATFTQRRRQRSASSREEAATPGGEESAARKVRDVDREYYRTHKPSPLAEVQFADTRKPITLATDGGGAAARYAADVPPRVVEDTVDDTLARAEVMFRDAASRGNPEWPHSRALAEMLTRRNQASHAPGGTAPWGS